MSLPLFQSVFDSTNYDIVDVKLPFKGRYPIYVGSSGLQDVGPLIDQHTEARQAVIVTHPGLSSLAETVVQSVQSAGLSVSKIDIPEGEASKSFQELQRIIDHCISHKMERKDVLIAVGGGVIGDLTGFAAAVVLRGISFVQVPTSLLAQVDAAIGGKTGINHPGGKNLIGSFYQPKFVFCDVSCFETLPDNEIRNGLAEVIKYGVIRNKQLFSQLERHTQSLTYGQYDKTDPIWRKLVLRSAQNKAYVVSHDEKESGLREILNFGHTVGHAIEALSGYGKIGHGEAVALGMIAASRLAVWSQLFSEKDCLRLEKLISDFGFNTQIPKLDPAKIIQKLYLDKKVRSGKIRFVLPTEIGKVTVKDNVPERMILSVLTDMA